MKTKFVLLLALTAVLASLLFVMRDAWSVRPYQNGEAYANISQVTTDEEGAIYTITDSKTSLQKVSSKGELVYERSSGELAESGTIRLFDSITSDRVGNAYVLVTILDQYGLHVYGEQIIRISKDGRDIDILHSEHYSNSEQLLRVGNIQSLSVQEEQLYFFRKGQDSAALMRVPAEGIGGADPEIVRSINTSEHLHLNELAGSSPDQFFLSSKKGRLFQVSNGSLEQIFPQSNEPLLNFPVEIVTRDHIHVYFIDYHDAAIKRLNSQSSGYPVQTLLSVDQLSAQYPDIPWSDFSDISVAAGMITIATTNQVVQVLPDGTIAEIHEGYRYPLSVMAQRLGYWVLLGLLAILVIYNLRFLYIHIMNRRTSLLVKQLVIIIPVVLASMIGLSYSVYSAFSLEMKNDALDQLELLAANGKYLVEGHNLESLQSPNDYMSGDYASIRERIHDLYRKDGDGRDGLYSTLYRYMDGQLYIVMDDDDSVAMFQPFEIDDGNRRVLKDGEVISGEWFDASGQWIYAAGPLYSENGDIIGIYETGKDLLGMSQGNRQILNDVLKNIGLIALVLLFVITGMTIYLLSSINKLRRNVNLIAKGELDVKVQIRTRDEVQELGERFNMMASSIRRYIEEVTKLSNSYFRFVPQQFLKVLGKTNMTEIQLGEQAKRPMTILVCNMRNFTEFSNQLTTEQNFKFMNSFLKTFGPVIREFGGFTSRYLGAGMLTMFPNHPDSALKAALKLRSTLEVYNDHRRKAGYDPIDIGIAVHSGDVMLGIIGEEQRMEGSVVSNHVQLALDLDKLSGKLGVNILLTEETLSACKHLSVKYRKLGTVQLSEDQSTINLYDVYEGDPEHIRKLKHETKQQFEEAVALFQSGRFYDAREGFVNVVRKNRDDLAAKLYFFACDRYFQEGVSADWNNALRVS